MQKDLLQFRWQTISPTSIYINLRIKVGQELLRKDGELTSHEGEREVQDNIEQIVEQAKL